MVRVDGAGVELSGARDGQYAIRLVYGFYECGILFEI